MAFSECFSLVHEYFIYLLISCCLSWSQVTVLLGGGGVIPQGWGQSCASSGHQAWEGQKPEVGGVKLALQQHPWVTPERPALGWSFF